MQIFVKSLDKTITLDNVDFESTNIDDLKGKIQSKDRFVCFPHWKSDRYTFLNIN